MAHPRDWYTIPEDLSIPKFLKRAYDPSIRLPVVPYSRPMPTPMPRPDNLTDQDRFVIAKLLEFEQSKSRRRSPPPPAADTGTGTDQPRPPSRTVTRQGLVDMKVIAQKLDISPREARAALRSLGMVKGEAGWVFPHSVVDTIVDLIRTTLAK